MHQLCLSVVCWQKSSICYLSFPDSYSGKLSCVSNMCWSVWVIHCSPHVYSFSQDVMGTLSSASGSVSQLDVDFWGLERMYITETLLSTYRSGNVASVTDEHLHTLIPFEVLKLNSVSASDRIVFKSMDVWMDLIGSASSSSTSLHNVTLCLHRGKYPISLVTSISDKWRTSLWREDTFRRSVTPARFHTWSYPFTLVLHGVSIRCGLQRHPALPLGVPLPFRWSGVFCLHLVYGSCRREQTHFSVDYTKFFILSIRIRMQRIEKLKN